MSDKHSKTPWVAAPPDGSYHDVIRIYPDGCEPDELPVAVCPQRASAVREVLSGATNETTEAASNARRIVSCVNACSGINPEAVPDMLEALRVIAHAEPDRLDHSIDVAIIERAAKHARAAIAKAEEVSP